MLNKYINNYKNTIIHCIITFILCFIGLEYFTVIFYLGREIAQSEYRYIEANGGKRYKCPWYCGLIPSTWTLKGLLDWVLPLIIAIIFNIIILIL